jgi:hypothetical protein
MFDWVLHFGLSNWMSPIFSICACQAGSQYNQSNFDMQSEGKNHMPLEDRRRSERFNFGVPLTVQWTTGSEQRQAHAVTQDVSSGGLYFFLPEAIPDGTAVEIEMTLPTHITLGTTVRVRCLGRIQRSVQARGDSTGMATRIETYEFFSSSEDVA